jgi:hypothetical protein
MTLAYDSSRPILKGQNIRPPLGSFFNGQSYWLTLYPEMGKSDRSVLVVKMILQFQFDDGENGSWTQAEKDSYSHTFVDSVIAVWNDKFRITSTSSVLVPMARDVGVIFEFPYYIDGWHADDDFEISVKKVPAGKFEHSSCNYNWGNSYLHTESINYWNKGGTMKQRPAVHEFGHMLGLRDEYPNAKDNMNHPGDIDSIMYWGELVRERHYAPFAGWLTEKHAATAHLTSSEIDYKVNGKTNLANAAL